MTNIVMLYGGLIPSCRLCGIDQLTYLQNHRENITFHHDSIYHISHQVLAAADVVLFVRSDSLIEQETAKFLKKAGKYLVYIIDDDLLSVPKSQVSGIHYNHALTQKYIKNCMSTCHCIASPSPIILKKYGNGFIKQVQIEEPCILTENNLAHETQYPIKVGFAGSIDRENDIDDIISEALIDIKDEFQEKVTLEFFGAFPNQIPRDYFRYYPYENDYDHYKENLASLSWDIGLAPMPDSPFHQCKHYNKFLEYAGCDIVGIYSNLLPYTRIIKDGENGILCKNTKEDWTRGLSRLINQPEEIETIKNAIRDHWKEKFSIAEVAHQYLDSFGEILQFHAPAMRSREKASLIYFLPFYRGVSHLFAAKQRFHRIVKENGWNTLFYIALKIFKKISNFHCNKINQSDPTKTSIKEK